MFLQFLVSSSFPLLENNIFCMTLYQEGVGVPENYEQRQVLALCGVAELWSWNSAAEGSLEEVYPHRPGCPPCWWLTVSLAPFVEFCSGQDALVNKTGRHKQPCQRVVDGVVLGALHSSAGSWRYLNLCWLCLRCGAAKRALGSSTNSSCGPCSVGLTTGSSKRGWILHLLRFSEMSARAVYSIFLFFFSFFYPLFLFS